MQTISPKPIIVRVVRTWCVPPGLTFALVEDVEHQCWVVESCPVGTHFWTVAQAAQLPRGVRTRRVLEEVASVGRRLEQARQRPISLPRSISRETSRMECPVVPMSPLNASRVRSISRPRRQAQETRSAHKTLVGV